MAEVNDGSRKVQLDDGSSRLGLNNGQNWMMAVL